MSAKPEGPVITSSRAKGASIPARWSRNHTAGRGGGQASSARAQTPSPRQGEQQARAPGQCAVERGRWQALDEDLTPRRDASTPAALRIPGPCAGGVGPGALAEPPQRGPALSRSSWIWKASPQEARPDLERGHGLGGARRRRSRPRGDTHQAPVLFQ